MKNKSNLTIPELEKLCEKLELKMRIMKNKLREVSKQLNLVIRGK